jgi:phytoene synthase
MVRIMTEGNDLSYSARLVRDGDSDRFLTALFAPESGREGLFALYAFNLEIARVPEAVSEPMMGQIRLQWWRDRIAEIYAGEPPKGAEVAQALCRAIRDYNLPRDSFDALLDARERDLSPEPPATIDDFEVYAESTSGELVSLALHTLGVADESAHEAGQHVGICWAIVGHLRAARYHAGHNRVHLPADVLDGALEDLRAGRATPALAEAAQRLGERAEEHLKASRDLSPQVTKAALPALLLAPLADGYLGRLEKHGYDLFSPELEVSKPQRQLRLAWAAWRRHY